MKKLTQFTLGVLLVLSVACEKKGSDPAPAAPPATQYNYVNGQCYDTTINQPAAINLCANVVINGAYRWNGVNCIDTNGATVATTLCYINGVAPGTGVGGVANPNYRWNGVTCTDLANKPVATTFCQTNTNSQFQIVNGNCIATMTGQWVNPYYCQGVAGYNPNQCNGYYIKMNSWGFYYTKYCQGTSCSGQSLIEYSTGRPVTCQ